MADKSLLLNNKEIGTHNNWKRGLTRVGRNAGTRWQTLVKNMKSMFLIHRM